ncbi:GGDEF domain-containing protein [uncultured Paraglaciecola sp.]|uniref:GGDEF domain-containing protein n=1 Tax=uncultured Paraglaciecola sp. TaxID=1765024 RepID=UPI0030DBC018|tara:strand:- start:13228 stop:14133 length:906 start_codon:yes stop_codon:yes gene_type:complete
MLEQLTQLYNTNVGEPYFSLEELNHDKKQGLTQSQLNNFILKLLTTIDLPKLSELYFQQLQNTLPLSELKIQFEDDSVTFGQRVQPSHLKTLNCMQLGTAVAVMDYCFTQPLSIRDWQILQQMHVNFCNPFKNALEHHKIKQFAMKDFLTSLGNRASYDETMIRLASQSQRSHQPFGLLILDMDNFKQVNDIHGHQVGDKVLMACADTIVHSLRESDFAFRFGGDEFCCLLPEADTRTNNLIAERIRSAFELHPLLQLHHISCSIGSATYGEDDSQIGIFSRADEALYTAKQAGKNCIRNA